MANLPERLMVRRSTFYCRIWVPRDVAPIYGRQLVVISLRTKDLKTAKSRLARKSVELEDQFEAIRSAQSHDDAPRTGSGGLPSAARSRIAAIAGQHAVQACDREFAYRAEFYEAAMANPAALWAGELCELPTPADFGAGEDDAFTYYDHLVAEGDLEKVIAYLLRFRLRKRVKALASMQLTGNLAEFSATARSLSPGLATTQTIAFARLLLQEELRAFQAILDGNPDPSLLAFGSDAHQPPATTTPSVMPLATAQEPASAISLDELWQRWERESEPSASTLSTWRGVLRNLKENLGRKADDVGRIEPKDIVAWKDSLLASGRSASTVSNGYLACARALFRFAVANMMLAADPSEGIKVSRKKKAGTKMLGYDRHEVLQLLSLASRAEEPWKRWLPWLAAATGSRIGEVAQLHGSNVFELEGIPVIKIAPSGDGGSIKNAESERTVPVHSALIQEGFLDFVRGKGEGPLFYSRTSGDRKRKHASKGIANRLATWIRENGFTDPRKAPNHALRHWFKSEAARVGIPDSVADYIQGHRDGRASAVYRHFDLRQIAEAIERIELPPAAE